MYVKNLFFFNSDICSGRSNELISVPTKADKVGDIDVLVSATIENHEVRLFIFTAKKIPHFHVHTCLVDLYEIKSH